MRARTFGEDRRESDSLSCSPVRGMKTETIDEKLKVEAIEAGGESHKSVKKKNVMSVFNPAPPRGSELLPITL